MTSSVLMPSPRWGRGHSADSCWAFRLGRLTPGFSLWSPAAFRLGSSPPLGRQTETLSDKARTLLLWQVLLVGEAPRRLWQCLCPGACPKSQGQEGGGLSAVNRGQAGLRARRSGKFCEFDEFLLSYVFISAKLQYLMTSASLPQT